MIEQPESFGAVEVVDGSAWLFPQGILPAAISACECFDALAQGSVHIHLRGQQREVGNRLVEFNHELEIATARAVFEPGTMDTYPRCQSICP